ncbi:glutamate--tRNA ligase [Candidatus Woesebacteria bacterium]|nr:glutamate--tRNA ligase [Candidatus Woesebacteria bacterium]
MDKGYKKLRTRFAPSPTGSIHIGSLRTALFSYALAKSAKGDFILRIEDTDKKREVEGSREEIKNHLMDFGLVWDEFYIQSERKEKGLYKKAADELVKKGFAFYCSCKARNAKEEGYSKQLRDPCREKDITKGAVKLKVPEDQTVKYRDYVLDKEIEWNTKDVADTTLLKSDGFPTYHLAVVVDDNAMKITHALRGYDWLPSTPIHLLLYKYLDIDRPEIGHLTDILDPDGGKLSKRKGSVTVNEFLKQGYLREALLNFVMLLGWAPKDNREFFTLEEFVSVFGKDGLQKSNPMFNRNKLLWMNSQYIKESKNENLKTKIYKFYDGKYEKDLVGKITPLVKERMKLLSDYESLAGFFTEKPKVDKKLFGENWQDHLKNAFVVLESIDDWELSKINDCLMELVQDKDYKTGKFFMDLRIAITGNKVTPPINESLVILGKEETLERLQSLIS